MHGLILKTIRRNKTCSLNEDKLRERERLRDRGRERERERINIK